VIDPPGPDDNGEIIFKNSKVSLVKRNARDAQFWKSLHFI
jgi:hypothetical protein